MKILFADNSLWAQLNFRGSIITHLRDVGHEVVMVSPIDAQSQEIVIPDRIRHIAIEMRRTSTNPLHDILYFFRLMSITGKNDRIIFSIVQLNRIYTVRWQRTY